MLKSLEEFLIDHIYLSIISNIYNNATTTVHYHFPNVKIMIERDVRQGDTVSPKLFINVMEHAFKTLQWSIDISP